MNISFCILADQQFAAIHHLEATDTGMWLCVVLYTCDLCFRKNPPWPNVDL